MATLDNVNDREVMMDSYDEYNRKCGGSESYSTYKAGFMDCYLQMAYGDKLELREIVKSFGVENYFNDSVSEVADKIEKTYPEIANEIANKRIANVIDGQNFTEDQMNKIMKSATTENIKAWFNDATEEDIDILAGFLKNFYNNFDY